MTEQSFSSATSTGGSRILSATAASQDTPTQTPFAQLVLGAAFLEELGNSFAERGLPRLGRLSVETILTKAYSLTCASEDDQAFGQASEIIGQYAEKVFDLHKRVHQRAAMTARGNVERPSTSDNPSTAEGPSPQSTGDRGDVPGVGKRPRTDEPASASALDDRMAARTTAFTSASPLTASGNPFCADVASSPESKYFAPLLIAANLARRKVCAAIARMGTLLVDLPEDQILDAPDAEFAAAPIRGCADSSSMPEEGEPTLEDVLQEFSGLRSAAAELKAATSRAVNIYWLANHTQGANWDTVAQLAHREKVDAYMSAVTDGYTPLSSWDERVKTAMKEARQEQHLAKDGSALGPLCPELLKRFGPRAGNDSQSRQGNRDGSGGGRWRGSRYPYKGRSSARGKENRRSGGSAKNGGGDGKGRGRDRPAAAAPGAAAAAAAGAAADGAGG